MERLSSDESRERFVKFSKTILISNSLFSDTSKQSNSGAHCLVYFTPALPCSARPAVGNESP